MQGGGAANEASTPAFVRARRPSLVWIICRLLLLAVLGAFSVIVDILSKALALPIALSRFLGSIGVETYLGFGGSIVLGIMTLVTLFRMKRQAAIYATLAFVFDQIKGVLCASTTAEVCSLVVEAAILYYVWRLRIH